MIDWFLFFSTHSVVQNDLNYLEILACFRDFLTFICTPYILKMLKKINMSDYFFEKLQFSNLLLHRIELLMDFNWFRCTCVARRRPHFMASGTYAKITYIRIIQVYFKMTLRTRILQSSEALLVDNFGTVDIEKRSLNCTLVWMPNLELTLAYIPKLYIPSTL